MWCHHILLSDIILNKSHVDLEFGLSFSLWFNNISICTSDVTFEFKKKKYNCDIVADGKNTQNDIGS